MTSEKDDSPLKRVTFALTEKDFEIIETQRENLMQQGLNITKSEVIRVALRLIDNIGDSFVIPVYNGLDKRKPGRPKDAKNKIPKKPIRKRSVR